MNVNQLIAFLNALTHGDLDALRSKLDDARRTCMDHGFGELAERLDEAREALVAGDLKTYRKRVESVVSRLGHLRGKAGSIAN